MSPEARVFRPRSETEDNLIGKVMELRARQGVIQKPSWTQYVSWLVNRDIMEVRAQLRQRTVR